MGRFLKFNNKLPSTVELHTNPLLVEKWVSYGVLDSELTYFLYYTLREEMLKLPVNFNNMKNVLDIYEQYWLPFGELLTEIEQSGIRVNKNHLIVI